MEPVFLSDAELYYTPDCRGGVALITGEEAHHISVVMRHKTGDEIFVTNGAGKIHKTKILEITKNEIKCKIIDTAQLPNLLSELVFCVPRLKSTDRLEYALEKCVELGITNFIVFDSQRSVAKGDKSDRWRKILTAAMKQSLRAWLPKVEYCSSVEEILKLEGIKVLFDQKGESMLRLLNVDRFLEGKTYFIFGPEGGFSESEIDNKKIDLIISLTKNRLRSETAVVTAAAIICSSL